MYFGGKTPPPVDATPKNPCAGITYAYNDPDIFVTTVESGPGIDDYADKDKCFQTISNMFAKVLGGDSLEDADRTEIESACQTVSQPKYQMCLMQRVGEGTTTRWEATAEVYVIEEAYVKGTVGTTEKKGTRRKITLIPIVEGKVVKDKKSKEPLKINVKLDEAGKPIVLDSKSLCLTRGNEITYLLNMLKELKTDFQRTDIGKFLDVNITARAEDTLKTCGNAENHQYETLFEELAKKMRTNGDENKVDIDTLVKLIQGAGFAHAPAVEQKFRALINILVDGKINYEIWPPNKNQFKYLIIESNKTLEGYASGQFSVVISLQDLNDNKLRYHTNPSFDPTGGSAGIVDYILYDGFVCSAVTYSGDVLEGMSMERSQCKSNYVPPRKPGKSSPAAPPQYYESGP